MWKKLLTIIITLLILVGVNLLVSKIAGTHFVDFSFGVGLLISVIISFFTSSGGFTSKYADTTMQANTVNWKMKNEKYKLQPSTALYTSVAYTVLSIVITFYYYKDYFID